MNKYEVLIALSLIIFSIGFFGAMVRRNALVVLMCLELMLNGVVLCFVTFSKMRSDHLGVVFAFIIFIIAASEIAIAIPILLRLMNMKNTLDISTYGDLKG